MNRRTLLHNLFSSVVAVPMLGAYDMEMIEARSSLGHKVFHPPHPPEDEVFMRRAIQIAGNVPKHPFGALLVDGFASKVGIALGSGRYRER